MAPALLLLFLVLSVSSALDASVAQSDIGYISAVISESGLAFAKDLLVERAIDSLIPLCLHDIEKSVHIPLIGWVHMRAANITLSSIDVSSSTVKPGESGIVIVASGATASLSFDWSYSYSSWLIPIEISDKGRAFVQVEGMEVGLTMTMDRKNGTLELAVAQCGCYMENLVITLDGGASWFYQGFVYAFANHIQIAVEDAITQKIVEGAQKLDSLLQTLPKKIYVDKVAALNVTFVNDPILTNSSLELDIKGLFISSDKTYAHNYLHKMSKLSYTCYGEQKMLSISLDEAVFNSASVIYFQAGLLHWMVDKIPQQSLLNTASWKYLIPQLYKKYPNDDMLLNMSLTSPPDVWIISQKLGAVALLDMTVIVLDGDARTPVACISMVVNVSGAVTISGNNLAGQVGLDDFTLSLKWSDVGKFHMSLIQGVVRVFLNTIFLPYVNLQLRQGFPLPIIKGFTLQNANILTTSSVMVVCSDLVFNKSISLYSSF
ncbi:putative BPI/LBP family protein At1g04970 [Zingiber officinale]|uniref:putative BPI/LBP family protein At1g04970 n=1 Tax=Zingiber officinale TaxID=94328 RepID=UPI001C4C96AE|nr:putative BPI/LBP family protein At1g04970 [Zingiber officinale]